MGKTHGIGPGYYEVPNDLQVSRTAHTSEGRKLVSVKRPPFNQSTKRAVMSSGNYNPGPGSYTTKDTSFKANFANNQLDQSNEDKGVFYVFENGNL